MFPTATRIITFLKRSLVLSLLCFGAGLAPMAMAQLPSTFIATGNVADSPNKAVHLLQSLGSISVSAVTNGASGLTGPVAPGEIVVIFGSGLGPAQLVSSVPGSDGLFGTEL